MSRAPTAMDLLQLEQLLDEDASRPVEDRRRRDRQIGRATPGADDTALLLAWLDARRAAAEQPGLLPLAVPVLLLAALAGWGTATTVFFYDGGGRVNVVTVLAVFVVLQALLLVLFTLAALPPSWSRLLPGLGAISRLASACSPARMTTWLARWLPAGVRNRIAPLMGDASKQHARLAAPTRWLLLALSQDMALVFNLAALATAATLVVFTDLAFGWATTLDAGDTRFLALVQTLATPWAALLPAAVPDAELVAVSRYFRLDDAPADAAALTRWWPFVIAAMAVYGVLPRLLAATFSHWRFSLATRRALLDLPAAQALLLRMRSTLVETAAPDDDGGDAGTPTADDERVERVELAAPLQVIEWAAFPLGHERLAALLTRRFGARVVSVHAAGGNRSLAEDRATAQAVAGAGSVLIACKAWEPPLLELRDFLQILRDSLGAKALIAVAPLAVEGQDLVAPAPAHMAQWRDATRDSGDPRLMLLRTHAARAEPTR